MVARLNDLALAVTRVLDACRKGGLTSRSTVEEDGLHVEFHEQACFEKGVPRIITWPLKEYQMSRETAEAAFITLQQIKYAYIETIWKKPFVVLMSMVKVNEAIDALRDTIHPVMMEKKVLMVQRAQIERQLQDVLLAMISLGWCSTCTTKANISSAKRRKHDVRWRDGTFLCSFSSRRYSELHDWEVKRHIAVGVRDRLKRAIQTHLEGTDMIPVDMSLLYETLEELDRTLAEAEDG